MRMKNNVFKLIVLTVACCMLIWVLSGFCPNVADDIGIDDDGFYILDGPELEAMAEEVDENSVVSCPPSTEDEVDEPEESEAYTHDLILPTCEPSHEVFNGEEYNIPISSQMGLESHPVMVFEPDELTAEILENRNGAIIIEMLIGRIDNVKNGDGTVLNTADDYYNYISYRSYIEEHPEAQNGDYVLTYCIYDPYGNYVDDILMRFDYPIEG